MMRQTILKHGRWPLLGCVSALVACGGGGSASSSSSDGAVTVSAPPVSGLNVQAVRVGPGPAGASRVANVLYAQVRVCAPGNPSNCQIIDHLLVDTGSVGLRLLKSAVSPSLQAALPGSGLYNCVQFLDGSYMWGPVVKANVSMGGDLLNGLSASNLPIQLVITSAELPATDEKCAGSGADRASRSNDDVSKLGANGILGIGTSPQDCGEYCANVQGNGYYYTYTSSVSGTTVQLTDQLQQPVSRFASHNNGTIIELPTVPSDGAGLVKGWLVFGIGTSDNNSLGSAKVFQIAPSSGYAQFRTSYGAQTNLDGFIDSGSNALFFGSRASPAFTFCADDSAWYCPATATQLDLTNSSLPPGATSDTLSLSFTNATALFANSKAYAYGNLAGEIGQSDLFDFGIPFFYGRRIFTGIAVGDELPYVAY